MNYLAHAFLSPEEPFTLTGNIVTDMLKGPSRKEIDIRFDPGILLHRAIDRYTDSHEIVSTLKHMLYSRFKKYAPVVSDIFMDYLLVRNWNKYSDKDLQTFIQDTYDRMNEVIVELPEEISLRLDNMIRHNWLNAYMTPHSINQVFDRMEYKVTDTNIMKNGGDWLEENFEEVNMLFLKFFPDLVDFVHQDLYTKSKIKPL